MIAYETVILISWAVYILVWTFSSFDVKRDIRGGYSSVWKQYALVRLVTAALLVFFAIRLGTGTAHFTNLGSVFDRGVFTKIFIPSLLVGWMGAFLCAAGVAFAVWARLALGRNWSPRPAVKENHELVTTGPYAYVRHPIYTGLISVALGSVLTGMIFGVIVFAISCIIFLLRIKKEEKIMLELFPDEYPEYRKRTRALIPFVW